MQNTIAVPPKSSAKRPDTDPADRYAALRTDCPESDQRIPDPIPFETLAADNPELYPPVIDCIARAGETFNLIAGSKRGKTWLEYMLALSVASGYHWLSTFPVARGRVLVIDNELHRPTIAFRLAKVAAAMGLKDEDWRGQIDIVPIRGLNVDINHLRPYFAGIARGAYRLIILDAFYKFTPQGSDENSNADMTLQYGLIDSYALATGATFCLVHHASKGVQGNKAVTDVGSGAGAQSRAADAHVVLRDHEENDCVVMAAEVRTFKRPEPICLRFEFPIWRHDPSLDPTKLRKDPSRGGRPRKADGASAEDKPDKAPWTPERFVTAFVTTAPMPKDAIVSKARREGITHRDIQGLVSEAESAGLIFRSRHGGPNGVAFSTANPSLFGGENGKETRDVARNIETHTHPPHPPAARRRKRREPSK